MHFTVSPEIAFDYLADPVNRPEWQSSLKAVEDIDGLVRVGQSWIDVTTPGVRPRMETTELDRPRRWTERGTWRMVTAELTLEFAPAPGGCEVGVQMHLEASGLLRPVGPLLTRLSPLAVRSDLKRAAAILAKRHPA